MLSTPGVLPQQGDRHKTFSDITSLAHKSPKAEYLHHTNGGHQNIDVWFYILEESKNSFA
jgi:hypothetical protein